jgi:hypothetical protein
MQDEQFKAISDIFKRLGIRISVNTGYGLKNPTTEEELVALRAKLQKGYPEIFSEQIKAKTEEYLSKIEKTEAERAKEEQKRRQRRRKEWNSAYQRFIRALRNRQAYPEALLRWSAETPLREQKEVFLRYIADFKRRALPLPKDDIEFGLNYIYSIVSSGSAKEESNLAGKLAKLASELKSLSSRLVKPKKSPKLESYVS